MTTTQPDEIRVGDRVRSYDFYSPLASSDTCYIEGVVEGIEPVDGLRFGMCDRYAIRVTRRVWHGREHTASEMAQEFPSRLVYPPINGTPCTLGGVTSGVKRLGPETPELAALREIAAEADFDPDEGEGAMDLGERLVRIEALARDAIGKATTVGETGGEQR